MNPKQFTERFDIKDGDGLHNPNWTFDVGGPVAPIAIIATLLVALGITVGFGTAWILLHDIATPIPHPQAPTASASVALTVSQPYSSVGAASQGQSASASVVRTTPDAQHDSLAAPTIGATAKEVSTVEFSRLISAMRCEDFDTGKLSFVKTMAKDRFFTSAQVRRVLETFDFDAYRTEAGVALFPRVVDSENFYDVYSAFDFDTYRIALRRNLKLE